MLTPAPLRVAVIGAGIGGTAAAAGLQHAGAEVTVFERAPQPRNEGAGLSLFRNGLTALDALGLGRSIREAAVSGSGLDAGYRRPDGSWLTRLPAAALSDLRVVHRSDLQRVLLDALAPGTVQYGSTVTAVTPDGTTITLDDGTGDDLTLRFDVVVAADGLHSRIRSGWPDDPGVRYSGYSAWRGVTHRAVDLRGGAGETLGRGLRFGVAPLAGGRVYWFAVVNIQAGTTFDDEYDAVVQRFVRWHAPIPELIAASRPDAVFRLDIHELDGRLPTFRRGRCVLLGDAAHAMTPNLGQGGNQALEDAATLVRLLSPWAAQSGQLRAAGRAAAVDAALTEYDHLRRPRTQSIARMARQIGAFTQAHTFPGTALRNTALRMLPTRVLAARSAAIQQWQPPRPHPTAPPAQRSMDPPAPADPAAVQLTDQPLQVGTSTTVTRSPEQRRSSPAAGPGAGGGVAPSPRDGATEEAASTRSRSHSWSRSESEGLR